MIRATCSYGVTLSSYRCGSSGVARLTPLVLNRVEADSPQEACYLVMEQHGYAYVDRVEVVLSDRAVWQRSHVLYKDTYDVALWRTDRKAALPVFEDHMQAVSPLLAALKLMQWSRLTYVARVSVRCPDGSMWRREHLRMMKDEPAVLEEDAQ
jgi:hypothetical protein